MKGYAGEEMQELTFGAPDRARRDRATRNTAIDWCWVRSVPQRITRLPTIADRRLEEFVAA
jgi:hypothetical protein